MLSATLAGLAGATKALVFQLASLTDVHWTMSGEVVLMTLLGGLGTVFGPVVGALVIITMENYLAQLGAWVTIVQGAHLRGLRADLPPRRHRRGRQSAEETALETGRKIDSARRAAAPGCERSIWRSLHRWPDTIAA